MECPAEEILADTSEITSLDYNCRTIMKDDLVRHYCTYCILIDYIASIRLYELSWR